MKQIKLTLALLLITFLNTGSFAQDNKTVTASHSHPEFEKKLEETKSANDKVEKEFEQAKKNYELAKDLLERRKATDDRFFNWLSFFGAIIFSGVVATMIVTTKSLKLFYQNKYEEYYQTLTKNNLKTIQKIISDEDWRNSIKVNKRILVLNQRGTGITTDFTKVISAFENHELAELPNLDQSLVRNYSDYDLVIIENADDSGYWKLAPDKGKENDINEQSEVKKVREAFITLGNKICPQTALIYYGKQGRGNFPSEEIEPNKRYMISYANTPSTLFSNIIDLLKFKDILENNA